MKRIARTMLLLAVCCTIARAQTLSDLYVPTPLPRRSTLVVGFLGGFEPWNDERRNVRKLVLKMRRRPGVYGDSISNHHRRIALDLIRRALDTNLNGKLESKEKESARIILFGQSLGGAAVVSTARDLKKLGIPVLLTVQVDSVGFEDDVIPVNVRAAVNFYQRDPLTIHGREKIRAEDPTKTTILGNFQASYAFHQVDESDASWTGRVFGGSHIAMENDPMIWHMVEGYISDAIAWSKR